MAGALLDALKKLDPRSLWRNPVMFAVEIASYITQVTFILSLTGANSEPVWFTGTVSIWLWLTVLFSTFAEALAEGRGKARAASLRKSRTDVTAKLLKTPDFTSSQTSVGADQLRKGDYILVEANDLIAGDGDVVAGAALVNEAAVTGESAPVVRKSGGDRSAVTGGTTVIANSIIVKITAKPGETFIDRMISLIEGAKRRKTPNEVALEVLLIALTSHSGLSTGLRQYQPAFHLQRSRHRPGQSGIADHPGGALRLPGPHHHCRPLTRHRHCRYGSTLSEKRHRPLRSGH